MFSRVISAAVYGIDAYIVNVETDVGFGLPTFDMSGALGSKVREAKDRVRVAIKNSGIELTPQKIVINISPANIRKEGTIYDLPIAIGILAANGCFDLKILENVLIIGEVSLDGSINPVKGVLPMVCAAKEAGIDNCIIPKANIAEGRIMNNINIYGVETLSQTIEILKNIAVIDGSRKNIKQADVKSGECNKSDGNINNDTYNVLERSRVKFTYGSEVKNNNHSCSYNIDYSDISGQEAAKRATMIAVSGMHNIMYIGPPGSGKTMLAQRIPTIMPDMDYEEQLRLTKIYSVAGLLDNLFGIAKKELLMEMIDDLADGINTSMTPDLIDEKVASMSCKAAVKGNNRLSAKEVDALIGELLTLDNPYHCPHGRPTIIAMTKRELEKKFKRIV